MHQLDKIKDLIKYLDLFQTKQNAACDFTLSPSCRLYLRSSGSLVSVEVIPYPRFGTTYRSHLQGSRIQNSRPLNLRLIGCSEISVRNYNSQKSAHVE